MSATVKLWVIYFLGVAIGGIATVPGYWWVCALIGLPAGWLIADVEVLAKTQRSSRSTESA